MVFAVIVDVRHASVKLIVKDLLLVTDGVDVSVVPLKYIDWEPNIEFRAEKSETVWAMLSYVLDIVYAEPVETSLSSLVQCAVQVVV